jgi:hypothetical protein
VSGLRRTHPALVASACLAIAGFLACFALVAPNLAPLTADEGRAASDARRAARAVDDRSPSVALQQTGGLRVRAAILSGARRRPPPARAADRGRATRGPAAKAPARVPRTAPVRRAPEPASQPQRRPAPRRPVAPPRKPRPAPAAAPDFDDVGPPEPDTSGSAPRG